MDYLKKLSIQLGGRIRSQENSNMNFKTKSFRALIIKNYKGFKIQIDEYANLFSVGIKVNLGLALSINNPDKIFLFEKPITLENFPHKLYVSNTSQYIPPKNKELKVFWVSFIDEIKKLKLDSIESVFFYENGIYLVLSSERNVVSILDDIIDFIKDIKKASDGHEINISVKNIPKKLESLFPLLKKWGVGDDSERVQLIEETDEEQKRRLVESVYPLMNDINEFLDSFKNRPLTEEAILLGNLAELVSELEIE